MAAPVWPPSPEEAERLTLEEYGEQARAVLGPDATDDEAERALLAPFLFGEAPREADGDAVGTPLDAVARPLTAWLRMVSGRDVNLAYSDPPATDGVGIFLPRAQPAPAREAEDTLLFRCQALVQLGLAELGFLRNRALLVEIHRDWVLRSVVHLLATRAVVAWWSARWPGIAADFRALRLIDKAAVMRINHTVVPRRGMPRAFLPLYAGLVELGEEAGPGDAATEAARRAVAAVDAASAGLPLVVMGAAQRARDAYRTARLGAPPLPAFAGILRPEWILDLGARDRAAEDAWREGPAPLRLLRKAAARPGGLLRRALKGGPDLPPPDRSGGEEPRPEVEDGRRYDEWDQKRGLWRMGGARVLEVTAPSGPLERHTRLVEANQGLIREVRRRFEALRVEERWRHGQPDGPELDVNRALAAMADRRAGHSPSRTDWYLRFERERQSVAILVMVDVSGSTQGDLIYREQEALVVLAEGLAALRFPHALAAFSNHGPERCEHQWIKRWDEEVDEAVRRRLGNLRPGGATRLGAFVRHGAWTLAQQGAARRVLLVLSDGRPEDGDGYRGPAGVADTALAVGQARRDGALVFCVSMDGREGAEGYLREIFGAKGFLVMERPDDLPARLPEVVRGLIR